MKGRLSLGLILLAMATVTTRAQALPQTASANVEWHRTGGDGGNTRYSPLDQINAANVKNLQIAWVWHSDNFGSQPEIKNETTPIMVGGVLYFTAGDRRAVVAADPGTGETIWTWRLDEGTRIDGVRKNSCLNLAVSCDDREITTEAPKPEVVEYPVVERDDSTIRAFREDVLAHLGLPLVDVRSPGEYSGELLHMPDYPQEGAVRGGHIPGAASVPWARAAAEDATFKPRADLEAIYLTEQGLSPDDDVIAYCRIGERSSHTWFVLTHLLGFGRVRNYDGSWTEWGNTVRVPIVQGSERG